MAPVVTARRPLRWSAHMSPSTSTSLRVERSLLRTLVEHFRIGALFGGARCIPCRPNIVVMRLVGSSRWPATIDWVGHTITHDGSSPTSTRWAQALHLWGVEGAS